MPRKDHHSRYFCIALKWHLTVKIICQEPVLTVLRHRDIPFRSQKSPFRDTRKLFRNKSVKTGSCPSENLIWSSNTNEISQTTNTNLPNRPYYDSENTILLVRGISARAIPGPRLCLDFDFWTHKNRCQVQACRTVVRNNCREDMRFMDNRKIQLEIESLSIRAYRKPFDTVYDNSIDHSRCEPSFYYRSVFLLPVLRDLKSDNYFFVT